jgi:hypothetical protein
LLNSSCHLGPGIEESDGGSTECMVCHACGSELEPENGFYPRINVDGSLEDAMDRLAEGIEKSATQFARLYLGELGQEGFTITIELN